MTGRHSGSPYQGARAVGDRPGDPEMREQVLGGHLGGPDTGGPVARGDHPGDGSGAAHRRALAGAGPGVALRQPPRRGNRLGHHGRRSRHISGSCPRTGSRPNAARAKALASATGASNLKYSTTSRLLNRCNRTSVAEEGRASPAPRRRLCASASDNLSTDAHAASSPTSMIVTSERRPTTRRASAFIFDGEIAAQRLSEE